MTTEEAQALLNGLSAKVGVMEEGYHADNLEHAVHMAFDAARKAITLIASVNHLMSEELMMTLLPPQRPHGYRLAITVRGDLEPETGKHQWISQMFDLDIGVQRAN